MKKIVLLWCMLLASLNGYCYGEEFTVECNGINMKFKVLSNPNEVACAQYCINQYYTGDVVIPSSVEYQGQAYNVTELDWYAFYRCDMSSITLPSTLKTIRDAAIMNCRNITSLSFPASLEYVSLGALANDYKLSSIEVDPNCQYYCSIDGALFAKNSYTQKAWQLVQYPIGNHASSYTVPEGVESIGDCAFDGNSYLNTIVLPSTLYFIKQAAFSTCYGLQSLSIPASVIELEENSITGYTRITSYEVASDNTVYTAIDGVVYTKDGEKLIGYPSAAPNTTYSIKEGTTNICDGAFAFSQNLRYVTIPNSVKRIGFSAFSNSHRLQSIDIPESVTEIKWYAFQGCDSLKTVYLRPLTPPSVTGSIFGGYTNPNPNIFVPYQSVQAYRENYYFNSMLMHQYIDWHEINYYLVFNCTIGVDFSKTPGVEGFIVVPAEENDNNAKTLKAKKRVPEASGASLKLVRIDKAAPGECVLLKVTKPGDTYYLYSDETAALHTDNLLVGVTENTEISANQGDSVKYVFNGETFEEVTTSDSVSVGLGYLKLPSEMAQALGNHFEVSELASNYSVFDAQDNTALLSSHNDEFANVNFDSRTLYKDGKWNTICVPFDLPITGSILDGGIARTLADASISETTLTLTFGDPVDTLKAGVPYLIKWESGDDIVDPTFPCVTIKEDCHPVVFGEGDATVKFIGTYAPVALEKNTTKNLYLGTNNKLYYPTVDNFYVNAFRAYFQLGSDMANAHQFVVDFGDGKTTTGIFIEEVEQRKVNSVMYNLAGQRVDNGYQGIVIMDGKKVYK